MSCHFHVNAVSYCPERRVLATNAIALGDALLMIEVKPLQADQWALYKQMRIAALADAPHAFTASWTRAVTAAGRGVDAARRSAGHRKRTTPPLLPIVTVCHAAWLPAS